MWASCVVDSRGIQTIFHPFSSITVKLSDIACVALTDMRSYVAVGCVLVRLELQRNKTSLECSEREGLQTLWVCNNLRFFIFPMGSNHQT